jgi:hypothetical protein
VFECEASPDSSVESLKRDVEAKLKLGKETEQKLLFRGKALKDGTSLSEYKLTDGSKLNLVLKRRENNLSPSTPTTSSTSKISTSSSDGRLFNISPSGQNSTLNKSLKTNEGSKYLPVEAAKVANGTNQVDVSAIKPPQRHKRLDKELYRALRPHFHTNQDTQRVVDAFEQLFQQLVAYPGWYGSEASMHGKVPCLIVYGVGVVLLPIHLPDLYHLPLSPLPLVNTCFLR